MALRNLSDVQELLIVLALTDFEKKCLDNKAKLDTTTQTGKDLLEYYNHRLAETTELKTLLTSKP